MISLLTYCQGTYPTGWHVNPTVPELQRKFLSLLPRNYWLLRNVIDARMEPMGLSSAQWRPLLLLDGASGPMTQVQIARALGLESPTVVRLLDRLVEKGWVHRRNCPGDRRAYHVELTAAARALCADIEKVLTELRASVLAAFSRAELMEAVGLMERIQERMATLDDAGHSVQGKADAVSLSSAVTAPSNRMRTARQRRRIEKTS
ncbi:MarR family transcriptional regulator for hemolysin [Panacagrimonas perspica]|uniref:MarR family transcriptional regulator for hemolysin n=1 Tax=Panacagrimonas perspica TaxID=381431 RepID=A0A4R7NTT0_9GAMM|nr:MarR family transcriptional regulator for hemolysin [Panacagrimonas perspica]